MDLQEEVLHVYPAFAANYNMVVVTLLVMMVQLHEMQINMMGRRHIDARLFRGTRHPSQINRLLVTVRERISRSILSFGGRF